MSNDTLEWCSIPTLLGTAEHTYVQSNQGHVWPCWGRSAGGTVRGSGLGSAAQADCLAHGDSKAGIEYGKTGVCHQTANRILVSSGMNVSSAKGARVSYLRFGVFGRDPKTGNRYHPVTNPWPEYASCLSEHTHP